jgi:hypothetical protein
VTAVDWVTALDLDDKPTRRRTRRLVAELAWAVALVALGAAATRRAR